MDRPSEFYLHHKALYTFYYLHEGGYVIVVVCLSLNNFAQKLPNGFA